MITASISAANAGAHFFLLAEAHLPLLMAAHLPTAQQAALRRFSPQAQALLVARAMARYRAAHMHKCVVSWSCADAQYSTADVS